MRQWSTYFQNPAFLQSSRMSIMNKDLTEHIAGYLGLVPGLRVLDVGCGTGALTFYLCGQVRGCSFTGVDLDDAFIREANTQALKMPAGNTFEFLRGDATRLPFETGSFDLVISQTLLTALPEYRDALSEMRRVCKGGGLVASITPMNIWNPVYSAGHYPESHTYYERLCRLQNKVLAMMEGIAPMKQFVRGAEPTMLPRVFVEAGLGSISAYPLGKFFSLSNAATSREDKAAYIELSYKADADKFAAFWQLSEAKRYMSEYEAAEYLALLKEKRDALLRDIGENAIWDFQGGANLLLTGIADKSSQAERVPEDTQSTAGSGNIDILFLSVDRDTVTQQVGSLGQLCLTAYLKQFGYVPKVYIGKAHSCELFLRGFMEARRTGIVGFYITAENLPVARNIHRYVKKYGVTTILGGPETVALGESEIREIGCDYVIDGEGEIPLKALLDALIRGEGDIRTIAGLRYIDVHGAYLAEMPPGEVVHDLDSIGFAEPEDVLNPEYRSLDGRNILTGRGCPYNCAFCYEGGQTKKIRNRSVENVIAELDHYLAINPKIGFFMISDDTFTLDPERVSAICDGMAERKLAFSCEAHVQMLSKHPAMMQYMVDKGLKIVQIGLESGSQKVLDAYNKNTTPEMIKRVVENSKKAGLIAMEGNIIVGGAFEDRQTIHESRELARELIRLGRGMFICNTVLFTPFPQTRVTKNPEQFGMRIDPAQVGYSVMCMYNSVVSTEAFSRDEIAREQVAFEAFLEKVYREEVTLISRAELQAYYTGPNITRTDFYNYNQHWHKLIMCTPHLKKFLEVGFLHTDMFDINAVILRSFQGLVYDGDGALMCGLHRIYGRERRFLELATGVYTLRQLSDMLGLQSGEVYEIYNNLYDKCLVYRMPF